MVQAYLVPWEGPVLPVQVDHSTKVVERPALLPEGIGSEFLELQELEYPKGSWQVLRFYVNRRLNADIVATKIVLFFGA